MIYHFRSGFFSILVTLLAITGNAYGNLSIDNPKESIKYWQQFVVENSKNVELAQETYQRLSRQWVLRNASSPPGLYVITQSDQAWAASLEDGNILLTQAALNYILETGNVDQLAFVLSHEIAHQEKHRFESTKFRRLAQHSQSKLNEKIEKEADEDAIIKMAISGFDPFKIVYDDTFLKNWVENTWGISCTDVLENVSRVDLCVEADIRETQLKNKLRTIAKRTLLFELGVQNLLAGQLMKARELFFAFEKDYPSHIVHDNIGQTYLLEALSLTRHNNEKVFLPSILVNTKLDTLFRSKLKRHRSANQQRQVYSHNDVTTLSKKAEKYFRKALTISPNKKSVYHNILVSLVLQNKHKTARALLEEEFVFAENPDFYHYLNAILFEAEGKYTKAANSLEYFIATLSNETSNINKPYYYSAVQYLSRIYQSADENHRRIELWNKSVDNAIRANDIYLFNQSVVEINNDIPRYVTSGNVNVINQVMENEESFQLQDTFWVNGEPYYFYLEPQTQAHIVTSKDKLIKYAWHRSFVTDRSIFDITTGDQYDVPLKKYGMPDSKMLTHHGYALNYDQLGISFYVENNIITGWFNYAIH